MIIIIGDREATACSLLAGTDLGELWWFHIKLSISMRLYCNARAIGQSKVTSDLNGVFYSWIVKSGLTHIASLVGFLCPAFGTSCQRGNRRTASAPLRSVRLLTLSEPPCASAIWRLSAKPIPDPWGLVVKNGTNRLVGFIIP